MFRNLSLAVVTLVVIALTVPQSVADAASPSSQTNTLAVTSSDGTMQLATTSDRIKLLRVGKRVHKRLKAAPNKAARKRIMRNLTRYQKKALRAYLKTRRFKSGGQKQPVLRVTTAQLSTSQSGECYTWKRKQGAVNSLGWPLWELNLVVNYCVDGNGRIYNAYHRVVPRLHALFTTYREVSRDVHGGNGKTFYDVNIVGEFQTCIVFRDLGCFLSAYPWINIHVEGNGNNYYEQGL